MRVQLPGGHFYLFYLYTIEGLGIIFPCRAAAIDSATDTKGSDLSILLFVQMKQSMNTVAVKKRKKIPQSRRGSPGIV